MKSIAPFRNLCIQYSIHCARQAGWACGIKHTLGYQIYNLYTAGEGGKRDSMTLKKRGKRQEKN